MKFEEFSKRMKKMPKYLRNMEFTDLYYGIYGNDMIGTNQELLIKIDMLILDQKFGELHRELEYFKFLRKVKELMDGKK